MNLEHFVNVQYCYDFLINQIPVELLMYSHIPTALASLLFSGFILYKVRSMASVMLFATCSAFAVWSIADLGSWFAFFGSNSTMFLWSLLDLVGVLMFFFAYYFLYIFIFNKKLPNWQRYIIFIGMIPVILYTLLGIHLPLYDANSCATTENELVTKYPYIIELLFIISSILITIMGYKRSSGLVTKSKVLLSGLGVFLFLTFFFSATLVVSILAESDMSTYVYNYEIYGLFGMPILLVYLGYLIVRFNAFNIKLAAAQALVFGLMALIGAQIFFVESTTNEVLVAVTFVISCIGGFYLVRSVKREIKQREEIEKLAVKLERTNVRLQQLDKLKSEFVSIASHQLRSPLTSIRGYISMMQEGSFGAVTAKMVEPLKRINESASMMATSIEDFLSVSRIESGNMKYEYSDFNLRDQAEHIVDDLRPEALKKGLLLLFRTDLNCQGIVKADVGKTQQILHNLINNSLKYTPKGTITVYVHDDKKRKLLYVEIIDTGIGMSQVTIDSLFEKFTRAQNANSVNIKGTGLGLFVAREMARAMKGDVTAHSEGEGKGSHFIFTIPFQQ